MQGLDGRLAEGGMTALIGPNGAGKSTLLRILAGELQTKRGEVCLFGKPLASWPAEQLARQRAVLAQESPVPGAFTVGEVVQMGRYPHRQHDALEPEKAAAIVDWALRTAEVENLRERALGALSGGERQRVQWARVLAQMGPPQEGRKPRCLFLDEPVHYLDPSHQHKLLMQAKSWMTPADAVVVVLHDVNLAMQYADYGLLLQEGKIIQAGPVQEVLRPEPLLRVFGMQARLLNDPERPQRNWIALYPR